ncbi:hypothetical protein GCM10009639_01420 [Kitasatospora putterlickiae]|uniref:Calcium/calmodulin-dependent protein kinase II association-domain domain-containing protein n=1 Tax=Kitasatospora putterlickiae TaxID=221725 RepID=A0ABN1XIG8_9ACTN
MTRTIRTSTRTRVVLAVAAALAAAAAFTAGVGAAQAGDDRGRRGRAAESEIAGLFDAWNAALRGGEPAGVAERYAGDAVLLPTASPRIRSGRPEIADYFEHFLRKRPRGERIRSVITVLDADSAIDAGLYRFHLTDPRTGAATVLDARYSFEYEKRGGTWLIVNHHSSTLPAEG